MRDQGERTTDQGQGKRTVRNLQCIRVLESAGEKQNCIILPHERTMPLETSDTRGTTQQAHSHSGLCAQVERLVGADIVSELTVPASGPGGVPARLSTAASGGGGGICRKEMVENC